MASHNKKNIISTLIEKIHNKQTDCGLIIVGIPKLSIDRYSCYLVPETGDHFTHVTYRKSVNKWTVQWCDEYFNPIITTPRIIHNHASLNEIISDAIVNEIISDTIVNEIISYVKSNPNNDKH
jgi:hypothetical protein